MDSTEKAIVERGLYKRAHNRRENERMIQTQERMIIMVKDKCDVGLVVNERSGTQSEKVETNQCDEVKIKFDMDEIETRNIELEYQVASLLKENEHLKLVYKNLFDSIKKSRVQTQSSNITRHEEENLRSKLSEFEDKKFDHILGKGDSFPSSIAESNILELEKESREKKNICESAKCELQTKIVELEKVLNQHTKDFDDVKLELPNKTTKFEAYFEKLENTKVVLERQLARKDDDSKAEKDQFLKEINHLRT
ncbi:hypothetical protein Tco_0337486 [Tanacetum coccineum]